MIRLGISKTSIEEILRSLYVIRWKEELEKRAETPANTLLVGCSHGMGYKIHLITVEDGTWITNNRNGIITIKLYSREGLEDHESFVGHLGKLFQGIGHKLEVKEKPKRDDRFVTKIHSWEIPAQWRPPRFQPPKLESILP